MGPFSRAFVRFLRKSADRPLLSHLLAGADAQWSGSVSVEERDPALAAITHQLARRRTHQGAAAPDQTSYQSSLSGRIS